MKIDFCINCCYSPTSASSIFHDNFNSTVNMDHHSETREIVYEIPIQDPLGQQLQVSQTKVKSILFSIFKLNYLTPQHKLKKEAILLGDVDIGLCDVCSPVLTSLFQNYTKFNSLGQKTSHLSKAITKLDEYIHRLQSLDTVPECHQHEESGHSIKAEFCSPCDEDYDLTEVTSMLGCDFHEEEEEGPDDSKIVVVEESISNPTVTMTQDFTATTTTSPIQEPIVKIRRLTTSEIKSATRRSNRLKNSTCNNSFNSRRGRIKFNIKISSLSSDDDGASDDHKKVISKNSSKSIVKMQTSSKNRKVVSNSKSKKAMRIVRDTGKNSNKQPKNKNYLARRTKYANPCWYCKRTDFITPADCVEHTKKEHLPKNNSSATVCERCSKICIRDASYAAHMQRCQSLPSGVILPKLFQCSECPKSFGSKKGLQSHILHHSTDRPYPCDECHYQGKTALALNLHKVNKHSVEGTEVKVQCDVCQIFVKNLQLHKFNMHTEEGYKKYRERQQVLLASLKEKRKIQAAQSSTVCPDCNVDMYSRLAFMNHRRSFHGDNMGKEYICEKCGRDFMKPSALKLHMDRVHSEARNWVCEQCGKKFKAAHNLRNHYEHTHTTEGRLKYNEKMRERNRRRKLLESQLARKRGVQSPTQIFIEGVVDGDGGSLEQFQDLEAR